MPEQGTLTLTRMTSSGSFKLLNQAALNDATPADRRVDLFLDGKYSELLVTVDFTRSTATTVTCTPSGSIVPSTDAGGSIFGAETVNTNSSGTVAVDPAVYTRTTSISGIFNMRIPCKGIEDIQLLFGGAAAGAGDLVDVYVTAIAGS